MKDDKRIRFFYIILIATIVGLLATASTGDPKVMSWTLISMLAFYAALITLIFWPHKQRISTMYDINKHGDFRRYYDTTQQRNIWVLGYFGGGSVAIAEAYEIAKLYANKTNVPLETVKIDEILKSRRHKGFKFVFSTEKQTIEPEVKEDDRMENVYQWLTD